MLTKLRKLLPAAFFLLLLLLGLFFLFKGTVSADRLEIDAREALHLDASMLCVQDLSEEAAVLLFYTPDRTAHSYAIYLRNPLFPFSYRFANGGSSYTIATGVSAFTYPDRATLLLSLNTQGAALVELTDTQEPFRRELDPTAPFALVLPPVDQEKNSLTTLHIWDEAGADLALASFLVQA